MTKDAMPRLDENAHIPALDGVRGLAVMMVMVLHFDPQLGSSPFMIRCVFAATHLGQTGVDLFFVLSGFLITGILLRSKGSTGYLRNFYMRRILRIFPLYYGTLLVLYVLAPALAHRMGFDTSDQWWFWLYAQNIGFTFREGKVTGPNHFWSLAVEEHFYLVWPLLVYWCPMRRLWQALLTIIGVALVIRAVLLMLGYGVFYFTLCRMDALAFGSLLALFSNRAGSLKPLKRIAYYGLLFIPPVLGCYWIFMGGHLDVVGLLKFPVIAGLCCLLLIFVQTSSIACAIFSVRSLRLLGKYSYALYVFHPFSLGLFSQPMLRGTLGLVLYFLLNLGIAWLSWHLFEKHFLRLKHWFAYSPVTSRSSLTIGNNDVVHST